MRWSSVPRTCTGHCVTSSKTLRDLAPPECLGSGPRRPSTHVIRVTASNLTGGAVAALAVPSDTALRGLRSHRIRRSRVEALTGCRRPTVVEPRGLRRRPRRWRPAAYAGGVSSTSVEKRPTSKVAPAAVVPEEASVAAALLSHYRGAAEHRGANEDDVELLADEYVYDEEALRASLASAAQAAVSCGTPAVAGLSSGFSGRLVKQED